MRRALALAPSNDQVIYYCSQLAGAFGRTDAAIALARRGIALDPLNARSYQALGDALRLARRYQEIAAYQQSIAIDPEHADYAYAALGVSYDVSGLTSIRTELYSKVTRARAYAWFMSVRFGRSK